MSQLRKSASFRSRIPVRRARIPQRRCCSPSPAIGGVVIGGTNSAAGTDGGSSHKLRTNRSFAFEGGYHNSSHHHHHHHNSHSHHRHTSGRRYSSSSFSSSDESYESEAPHQKFIKQTHKVPVVENSMYISTDAISLDGLLDSVSSGSFSSPPSPVQYQNTNMPLSHSSSYESLDKYNVALETFKLSENVAHIPYALAVPQSHQVQQQHQKQPQEEQSQSYYNNIIDSKHQHQQTSTSNKLPEGIAGEVVVAERAEGGGVGAGGITTTMAVAAQQQHKDDISRSKKSFYIEKQKQLSDWYYIKSKKDVIDDDDIEPPDEDVVHVDADGGCAAGINGTKDILNGADSADLDESLMLEHNYVNGGGMRMLSESSQPRRMPHMGGSAGYASAPAQSFSYSSALTIAQQKPEQQQHLPIDWRNFNYQQQQQQHQGQHNGGNNMASVAVQRQEVIYENNRENNVNFTEISNKFRRHHVENNDDHDDYGDGDDDNRSGHIDDGDDDDVEYDETIDSINSRLQRNDGDSCGEASTDKCPPYYCPPIYNAQNYLNHHHRTPTMATNMSCDDFASAGAAASSFNSSSARGKLATTTTATTSDISGVTNVNVNVNLLKQHYQQQQQQIARFGGRAAPVTAEYTNMSFRRRNEAPSSGADGRRTKNNVELQLEHWENIGNINNVTRSSKRTSGNGAGNSNRSNHSNGAMKQALFHPMDKASGPSRHFSRSSSTSNCCFSNAPTKNTNNVNSNNNGSGAGGGGGGGGSSNNINKQNNNRSNILYNHQQYSEPFDQHHQHHPLEQSGPIQCSAATIQQLPPLNQNRMKQQQQRRQQRREDEEEQSSPQMVTPAPRSRSGGDGFDAASTAPIATPRAALRSRLIQKRSDETSCSSFEQLNIIGIPTADGEADRKAGYRVENENNAAYMSSTMLLSSPGHADFDADTNFDDYKDYDADAGSSGGVGYDPTIKATTNKTPSTAAPNTDTINTMEIYYDDANGRMQTARITENKDVTAATTADFEDSFETRRLQDDTLLDVKRRPLPEIPPPEQLQVQLQRKLMQQKSRSPLFGCRAETTIFPPKTTSCRSDCELSGSYASLECPSPPGPPVSLPDSRRDPQARLGTYLRTFYTDLSLKEPIIPPWAIPVPPGALCPARLEPDLRLNAHSHGFSDTLTVDQILISLQTKEGTFLEAPRRCLVECSTWVSRSNLSLRILHAWAKEPPWPAKGTPVALALFIPLSEVKRSFANYVEKELLPKGPLNPFANGFGGFTAAWNSLEALGPKLLILLDGYDSQKICAGGGSNSNGAGTPKRGKSGGSGSGNKHLYPADVHDLLEGKLFPEARVIITTSTTNCSELLPIIQRHIIYDGLTWGRSASLLGGGQWGGPSRLLDTVQECAHLRKVVRTPLGCLAVAAIYEATAGDLPSEELDVVESILNCVAPETSSSNVAELGRLALFCLKMKRSCITMAEIRMYCSSPESNILGCLDKSLLLGKSAKKKGEYVYNPMCPGMMEFLAANYIASLATRPGLLAAEITGLSIGDELDPDLLKVIKFSMGLLGERAHILLSRLTPLWLTPQIVFSLALAGGHSEDNLAALCDILGISKHPPISPLETKPLWVQVRSVTTDLMGWGMALKSPTCTLKNLEVIYQLEKHSIMESRNAIEIFLDSIALNESVSTLRLSSLIETEVKDSEISYLASCVSKLLLKPRLENFELVLTLLEEDPPILKLQAVVAALCRTIPRQPKLSFLLLDLGLSTSQLVQLSATLEKCPNVTRLSLPHLRCERGAISALASLLNSRPLSFLSLPSCWGARDDPPSSSGVSMGSGSGSSTGTSGLIKQGSLPGVPSPRSYAPGIFSSLPRGVYVPPTSLGRSATLPRQPLEQSLDKRSCDSVVSKTWYPTPACDGGPHNSGTLHDLLLAARESYSKLHGLDLSKAQLSLEDSMCLGETVRLSTTLHTLKLEGSSRLSEILPSVLGASESPCLQMLSIGSPRLSFEDSAIAMCARALTSCSTLRLLSLDGWSFRIENTSTLSILRAFLSLTSIRELSLANCRLQIGLIKSDTKVVRAFESRSVVVLKLAGAQATLSDATILRGPQLLPYVGGFPCLRELDLSAPARSGLGSTHSSPLILDDKCIISFFQNLHTHFGLLNTLKICNWVIHFDELSKTLKTISKCIRNSPISHLKMDGISVLDRPKKHRIESNFIHCFISSLPQLRWMGISLAGKKEDQITATGNAVLDLKGYEIDIKLSESTIEHAKLMAQAISLDGKFDIKVSTFGTSSGILIHAEKSGTKSLTRKHKD